MKLQLDGSTAVLKVKTSKQINKEEESSQLITLKSIARLIGVKEAVVRALRDTPTYNMPKPKMARCDGTDLYCRDEIEELLPFIQEAVAFFPNKKKLIKIITLVRTK